jgi:hypothetical protein
MTPFYIISPNYSIAMNAKVGSTTLSNVVVRQFYPELVSEVMYNVDTTKPNWEETPMWQVFCPKEYYPTKPVVLMVRDPIERFKSALNQTGISNIDDAVTYIRENRQWQFPHLSDTHALRDNPHFRKQMSFIKSGITTYLFKFPDHFAQAAAFIGITIDLPNLNHSNHNLTLDNRQTNLLSNYYSEDITLFNSISTAGVIYNPSSPV